jgi:hypothetical protein
LYRPLLVNFQSEDYFTFIQADISSDEPRHERWYIGWHKQLSDDYVRANFIGCMVLIYNPFWPSLLAMYAQNLGKMIRPHLGKMIMSELDSVRAIRVDSLAVVELV